MPRHLPMTAEQQAAQAQTEQTPAQPNGAEQGLPQADPKSQEHYEQVVLAGMEIIYADETHPQILTMLQQGADAPAQILAQAASLIVTQIDEQAGGQVPENVILPAASEILFYLVELAVSAGLFEVNEQVIAEAQQLLAMQLAQHYGVPPEVVEQHIPGAGAVMQAQGGSQPQSGQQPQPQAMQQQPAGPQAGQGIVAHAMQQGRTVH